MGLHSSPTGELFLDDVRVGRDRLIGEREDAHARAGAKETFTSERTGVAAMALGMVEQCLHLSKEYAKTRVQFGKPIGSFQAVKHKCVDMMVAVENARSLVYYACWTVDTRNDEAKTAVPMAKAYASDMAKNVTSEAIQVHGGIGFTWEHPAHLYFRRAKASELLLGGPAVYHERLLARLGI
jgi:alkylation response protein AidB-like acyl-CoA dehydrogenase